MVSETENRSVEIIQFGNQKKKKDLKQMNRASHLGGNNKGITFLSSESQDNRKQC